MMYPYCFPGREPHHPADRLHHVNDGLAGVEEHHRVERGDVNALGQATGVGKHPAHFLAGRSLQPVELLVRRSKLYVPSTCATSHLNTEAVRPGYCAPPAVESASGPLPEGVCSPAPAAVMATR